MRLGILLWIYKDPPVCENRAYWLRRLNPDTPIYCLFGGNTDEADVFAARLAPHVDDFHVFAEPWSSREKWLNGDMMLAAWFRDRGRSLDWSTIFVAQWDLALLAPVRSVCGTLSDGELLLPGLRPIADVEHFWHWLRPGSQERREYDAFQRELERDGPFPDEPLCCNFLACALPRDYLARYQEEAPDVGFLEYKMPILAQRWGFSFCTDHSLDPVWIYERELSRLRRRFVTMHAQPESIPTEVAALNALSPWGRRAFHPYAKAVPAWMMALPRVQARLAR